MSRSVGGTYTLPAGSPVVSGTTVSSTVENAFRDDVATELTDSLSRSGKGGMQAGAQLGLDDGTVAAPGLKFESDPDTGIYSLGANRVGIATGGSLGLGVGSNQVSVPDGTVSAPALTFNTDPDCGLYVIGANNVGVAVNGAKVLDVATTGVGVTGAITATAGAVATQSTTNGTGVAGTGNGTGWGCYGQGGASNGVGVRGVGGVVDGVGVDGVGAGLGAGGTFTGGTTHAPGLTATGGATNGKGAIITGTGTGTGVDVIATNGTGISVAAQKGIVVTTGGLDYGITTDCGVTPNYAPFRIRPSAQPANGETGAMYVNSSTLKLYVCTVAGTPGTWVVVGTQS